VIRARMLVRFWMAGFLLALAVLSLIMPDTVVCRLREWIDSVYDDALLG